MGDITQFKPALAPATDYPTKINALIDAIQAYLNEVDAARFGQASLSAKMAMKMEQGDVDVRVGTLAVLLSGLAANLSAGNNKITNLADAVDPGDAVNLYTAQALLLGGGSPGSIPITALGLGTLTDGQVVKRSGAVLVGVTPRGDLALDHGAKSGNYALSIDSAELHVVSFTAAATLTISSTLTNHRALVVIKNGGNAITLAGIDEGAPVLTNAASKQDTLGVAKTFGKLNCIGYKLNMGAV